MWGSVEWLQQCRINNGANGAAAPGPPQLGAPHKGFFFCTRSKFYIHYCQNALPDPAGGLTAPPRPPAVLHAASGSVGLGHRGSHSPREKPPTKVLHQAPHIGNPALAIMTAHLQKICGVYFAQLRRLVINIILTWLIGVKMVAVWSHEYVPIKYSSCIPTRVTTLLL